MLCFIKYFPTNRSIVTADSGCLPRVMQSDSAGKMLLQCRYEVSIFIEIASSLYFSIVERKMKVIPANDAASMKVQ